MKMPENFLEKVLNNAQKAVTNSINEDNDITNMEIVCNMVISISYGILEEYHNALSNELRKANIDIGKLELY